MVMRTIVLIIHDIRSSHNVGSLLRTAECLGVAEVLIGGYSPYPMSAHDNRLPHQAQKVSRQIVKTALGAEDSVAWRHYDDVSTELQQLKQHGFTLAALEQSARSVSLPDYRPPEKVAVIIGREVEGVAPELLLKADTILEIPQFGQKESMNVVQATAIALYHIRFATA